MLEERLVHTRSSHLAILKVANHHNKIQIHLRQDQAEECRLHEEEVQAEEWQEEQHVVEEVQDLRHRKTDLQLPPFQVLHFLQLVLKKKK